MPDTTPPPSPAAAPAAAAPAPKPPATSITLSAEQKQAIDQKVAQPSAPPESRPAWLPEKFKSPEALAEAYAALERKQSQGAPAAAPPVAPGAPPPPVPDASLGITPPAEPAVATAIKAAREEWAKSGKLSEDTSRRLATHGITEDVIASYAEGSRARQEASTRALMDSVGGPEEFSRAAEWAKQNVSDADLAAYNAHVNSGDASRTKLAVQWLHGRYQAEANRAPARTIFGGATAAPEDDTFQSTEQVREAMANPKYKLDPAYRDMVARRMKNFTGFRTSIAKLPPGH